MDAHCDVALERMAAIESLIVFLFFAVPEAKNCILIAMLVSPHGGRTRIEIPNLVAPLEAFWDVGQTALKAIGQAAQFTFGLLAEIAGALHEQRGVRRAERIGAYKACGIEPGPWAWFKALSDLAQALVPGIAFSILLGVVVGMIGMALLPTESRPPTFSREVDASDRPRSRSPEQGRTVPAHPIKKTTTRRRGGSAAEAAIGS
jgi:hypothetical protein